MGPTPQTAQYIHLGQISDCPKGNCWNVAEWGVSHLKLNGVSVEGPGHADFVLVPIKCCPVVSRPSRVYRRPRGNSLQKIEVPKVRRQGVDVYAGLGDHRGKHEGAHKASHPDPAPDRLGHTCLGLLPALFGLVIFSPALDLGSLSSHLFTTISGSQRTLSFTTCSRP